MAKYEIPLRGSNQTFDIMLGETLFGVTILWREAKGGGWFLDLTDEDENPVLVGLPISVGHDLFEPVAYMGIGKCWAELNGQEDRAITYEDMTEGRLRMFWSDEHGDINN